MSGTASGIQQKFWGKAETTFDSILAWLTTDALNLIDLKIEPTLAYDPTVEHVGTASLQNEIEGLRGGKWTAIGYIRPQAVGVAPDIGELLKAAYGTEGIVGGTSVTYSLTDSVVYATGLRSLQFLKNTGNSFTESAHGAWVEQIEYDIQGNSAPRVTLSGGFASYGMLLGGATVDGIHAPGVSAIQLQTGDAARLRPNPYVKFDTEDNAGAGYLVTDVAYATDIITIDPVLAGATADDDPVYPNVPAQTLAGTIQGGIECGLTVDAVSIGFISAKISIATGIKGLDREATANRANRLARGPREITGEIVCYFLDESNPYLGAAWNGTTRAIVLRAGPDTAGSRLKLNFPKVRINVAPVEVPEAEESTMTLSFMARQNAAAADEHTAVFD